MTIPKTNRLFHYANQFYDPVKAHEYYMMNRELQAKKKAEEEELLDKSSSSAEEESTTKSSKTKKTSTTSRGMSEEQREAWKIEKAKLLAQKQAEIKEAQERRAKQIEEFQARAADLRAHLVEKVKKALARIQAKAISDNMRLEKQVQSKMENVTAIPTNISGEQRAALMEKRQSEIDKIRGFSESKGERINKRQDAAKEIIQEKREEIRIELKTQVDKARETYKSEKEAIDAKYKDALDAAKKNVLATIPGKSTKKKKSDSDSDSNISKSSKSSRSSTKFDPLQSARMQEKRQSKWVKTGQS